MTAISPSAFDLLLECRASDLIDIACEQLRAGGLQEGSFWIA